MRQGLRLHHLPLFQFLVRLPSHINRWVFGCVVAVSACLHLFFAWHQPFTNDEGAYLYDARAILLGKLPAGDVLTKTPVSVLFFSIGEFLTQYSLFAARGVNIVVSMMTVIPIFLLVRIIASKKSATYAIYFWLLGSGPILFYTIGHTQAIASLFSVLSLLFWLKGIREKKKVFQMFICAGVCFALAFATRKIAIALFVPYAVSLFLYRDSSVTFQRVLGAWITGAGIVFAVWGLSIADLYGNPGVWQLIGGAYGDIVSRNVSYPESITSWGGGTERFFITALRAGTVYGVGFTIAIGIVGMGISKHVGVLYGRIIFGALTCISFGIAGVAFRSTALLGLVWILTGVFCMWWAWRQPTLSFVGRHVVIPLSYIVTLALLYSLWPVLLPEYIGDFLVPSTMLCAIALASYASRTLVIRLAFVLLLLGSMASMESVRNIPWTGMFKRESIESAARVLRQDVAYKEKIFTAAVIIPYISGHEVPFTIAHPQWYAYTFISEEDRDEFLPSRDLLEDEVQKRVHWKIGDQLTDYAYSGIGGESWELRHIIPNNAIYRDNPIRIYSKVAEGGESR